MSFFWFLSAALAGPLIERPLAGNPIEGQCAKVYPIHKGKLWPTPVVSSNGTPNCFAVLVPLSDYSDLLSTEVWATSIAQQYRIDTTALQSDIDWYKHKLELETQPKPWLERPATQRWLGRIETMVIVGIVTAGIGATYHYTAGSDR